MVTRETHHRLKTRPSAFADVLLGLKTFEVRYDDRGFRAGDSATLVEWVKVGELGQATCREIDIRITYVFPGAFDNGAIVDVDPPATNRPEDAVALGWVVLGFQKESDFPW